MRFYEDYMGLVWDFYPTFHHRGKGKTKIGELIDLVMLCLMRVSYYNIIMETVELSQRSDLSPKTAYFLPDKEESMGNSSCWTEQVTLF